MEAGGKENLDEEVCNEKLEEGGGGGGGGAGEGGEACLATACGSIAGSCGKRTFEELLKDGGGGGGGGGTTLSVEVEEGEEAT